jgi:hypothetical protein
MGDVTEDDIGKPVFTAGEKKVGTLRGMNGPTLYLSLADEMDPSLHSDLEISETSGITDDNGENLAAATRASVEGVTDDEIHFWPAYAAEAPHESVDYEEIPEEDSNVPLEN